MPIAGLYRYTVLQVGYTIYDSVYSAYMLNIHTNIHMLYAKNTHWYILRIEPESHVVYFAYTRYYHVRLLWVC